MHLLNAVVDLRHVLIDSINGLSKDFYLCNHCGWDIPFFVGMVPFSIVGNDFQTLMYIIHILALDANFAAAGVQILAELFLLV
jgi:hypothetical protein